VRSPHLCIMLAGAGFSGAAQILERAEDARAEREAISIALATIEGAQLTLRKHAKALMNTSAAWERGQLKGLEEDLVKRLGELVTREERHVAAH
jgi:hypothetical protein